MFHQVRNLKEFYKEYKVSTAIILVNLLLYIYVFIVGTDAYHDYGIIPDVDTMLSEPYRVITSAFLHGGILHLFFNMFCIFFIGPVIERRYKRSVYVILYLLFAVLSGIAVTFFGSGITVGASGAIFAMFGFCFVLNKKLLTHHETQSLKSLIVINVITTFIFPGISIAGHIGGLLSGMLIGYIIKKI